MAKSCGGTCSRRVKMDKIQKAAAAPTIRSVVKEKGLTMPFCKTAFDKGVITPHNRLAPNMAKWPMYAFCVCIIDDFRIALLKRMPK